MEWEWAAASLQLFHSAPESGWPCDQLLRAGIVPCTCSRPAQLQHVQVIQLCNELHNLAATGNSATQAAGIRQSYLMARLNDIAGDTVATGTGAGTHGFEVAARAAGVLVQRVLARLAGRLRSAGQRSATLENGDAAVLRSCAVELCQLEARAQQLGGQHATW